MRTSSSIAVAVVFLILLFGSVELYAGGGCPKVTNRLEDFAGCMAVMPGNNGTMYRGTRYDMENNSHAGVIHAMNSVPVVPPQVIVPPAPYMGIGYGIYPSMVSVAASQAYRENPHATFWSWWFLSNMMGYPKY
ncbi:MAG TPA: hypothetical protein PKU96_05670 [bacterium]|jgi:hypothetical protein|nr:hypothetical protein [Myxococcales bacterium]OQA60944.1 MAG: hypothetical protein BWY40_00791 [bacterium ADurb.Bin270]HPW45841.1 hypothetical protein [bacterium]HQH81055.1 hypothetical protein [bacterium]